MSEMCPYMQLSSPCGRLWTSPNSARTRHRQQGYGPDSLILIVGSWLVFAIDAISSGLRFQLMTVLITR